MVVESWLERGGTVKLESGKLGTGTLFQGKGGTGHPSGCSTLGSRKYPLQAQAAQDRGCVERVTDINCYPGRVGGGGSSQSWPPGGRSVSASHWLSPIRSQKTRDGSSVVPPVAETHSELLRHRRLPLHLRMVT